MAYLVSVFASSNTLLKIKETFLERKNYKMCIFWAGVKLTISAETSKCCI